MSMIYAKLQQHYQPLLLHLTKTKHVLGKEGSIKYKWDKEGDTVGRLRVKMQNNRKESTVNRALGGSTYPG